MFSSAGVTVLSSIKIMVCSNCPVGRKKIKALNSRRQVNFCEKETETVKSFAVRKKLTLQIFSQLG